MIGLIRGLNRVMGYVSTAFLVALMLITVVDVFLRYFFNAPITGTTEISMLLMVIIVFPALGWAAVDRMHVRVDLFVRNMATRTQAILSVITLTIALVTYAFVAWHSVLESTMVNRQTSLLRLSYTPFYWLMSISLVIFCLSIVILIIEDFIKVIKK